MARYRGDDIPSVSDYSHWNEDAQMMWYNENKYDMEHSYEVLDDFDDDPFDGYDDDEDFTEEEEKALDDINPWD